MKKNNKAKMISLLLGTGLLFGACGTTKAETITTTNNASASSAVSSSKAASSSSVAASSSSLANALTFTLDELAQYDGKNGNDAYVAVDGLVYDVTNAAKWQNGSHYGVQAGTDCTTAISRSPHGTSVLDGLPIVGTLTE
jgi:predicted heme/steroid binding protein